MHIPPPYSTTDQLLIHRARSHEMRAHVSPRGEIVAELLMQLPATATVVAAALLHECHDQFQVLEAEFDFDIARLAHAAGHSGTLGYILHEQEESRRALHHEFLDTIKDPRAAVIKVMERLAMLRGAGELPADTQGHLAEETLKMYVPLARQIGLSDVEREMNMRCLDILPKWDYQRAEGESAIYEEEIVAKGYHTNKLDECLMR